MASGSEDWPRVREVFEQALALPAADRSAYVAAVCAGQPSLGHEVERLLESHGRAAGFLSTPAADFLDDTGVVPSLDGQRIGPYLVAARIGAGGMGEVYKARDTRLDRTVAIKVLPWHAAGDPQARERFDREARAIAGLTHPHICALYDVGDATLPSGAAAGTSLPSVTIRYLVMEHLEGETLAVRMASGPLPIAQALHYAVQMASALDHAHRAGIVHRDLKPANVMLTKAGAKLLDFGLAKQAARRPASLATIGADSSARREPATITTPGMILGTVPYMAPEQLEGREADARTDVFAFGAVLYEMLTGSKAFAGATQASVIAAILEHEPASLTTVLPSVPAALDRVVTRCLAKDPDERWQSTADLASELQWIEKALGAPAKPKEAAAPVTSLRRRPLVYWAAAVLAAFVAGSIASAVYFSRAPADAPEMRMQIATPGGHLTNFALSPDGRKIVFQATAEGKTQLWLRSLDSETAQPLTGTDDAYRPFWSPDSRSIGFFANGHLKRIDVTGGPILVLGSAPNPHGGTWSQDGVILFTPQSSGPISRVPAQGGEAESLTHVHLPGITGDWWPYFLPDGRHFLFFAWGTPEKKGVYVASIDSKEVRRLFDANSEAVFTPPDLVLYARQGALVAQRVDMNKWEPVGDPRPVAKTVAVRNTCGYCAAVSASTVGPIAYRSTGAERQMVWTDRSGHDTGTVGAPDAVLRYSFKLALNGRTVAFARDGENTDIWLLDIINGVPQRFTFDAANKYSPTWSPDSSRIVFSWDPAGVLDLYEKRLDGAGNGTLLWSSGEHKDAQDWSVDGRFILYTNSSATTGWDLWALPLVGNKKPLEVAHTAFNEDSGRFSPEGRWVAYQSNETGRNEIYVQPFPGPGGKKQITSGGGTSPQWGRDGRELFFLTPDRSLAAAPITMNGSAIEADKPVVLFTLPPESAYAASRDGQRFLVSKIVKEASPITILLNWKPR
jgi:eukaryotic-like serine/threonine-protein kinase